MHAYCCVTDKSTSTLFVVVASSGVQHFAFSHWFHLSVQHYPSVSDRDPCAIFFTAVTLADNSSFAGSFFLKLHGLMCS